MQAQFHDQCLAEQGFRLAKQLKTAAVIEPLRFQRGDDLKQYGT